MSTIATHSVRGRRGLLVAAAIAASAACASAGAAPATAVPRMFPLDGDVVPATSASTASMVVHALEALGVPQRHIDQIAHQWAERNLG